MRLVGCRENDTDPENDSGGSSETETTMPGPYSLSPVIPSQEAVQMGTTLRIVMTDFLTSHGLVHESGTLTCRCVCGHCSIMPTSAECVCCREISAVVAKIGELGDTGVVCITLHPVFASVCLYVSLQWNLSNPEC